MIAVCHFFDTPKMKELSRIITALIICESVIVVTRTDGENPPHMSHNDRLCQGCHVSAYCHNGGIITELMTPAVMIFFWSKQKNVFAYFFTPRYCDDTRCWNPYPWKTRYMYCLCYIVNVVAADGLATQGAKASAGMVLTNFSRNIPASAPSGLTIPE